MLHLERKLTAHPQMLGIVADRLDAISHPALDDPDLASPALVRALAEIYQDTLSTLPFRIQVTGEVQILKNEDTADRIRAVLLAGIRSAVLWQQSQGRRWHLLLGRKKLERQLLLLMNQIHEIH